MSETVYIPFYKQLDPGTNTFVLDIDKNYLLNSNRYFEFDTVSLVPNLYSLQAYHLELSEYDKTTETMVDNVFFELNVDHSIDENVFYSPPTTPKRVDEILQDLNVYFEQLKPVDAILPPVIFDWVHVDTIKYEWDFNPFYRFYIANSQLLYGEPFDNNKHAQFLPQYVRETHSGFNYFNFPTNPNVWKDIRIRKHNMPNIVCAFTNDSMLRALGFDDNQLAYGKHNKRFTMRNIYINQRSWTTAKHSFPKFSDISFTTEVRVKPTKSFYRSPNYKIETLKGNAQQLDLIIHGYKHIIRDAAVELNVNISLEYNEATNQAFFMLPQSEHVHVVIKLPSRLAYTLGYGHKSQITKHDISRPMPKVVSLENISKVSKVLAIDTGMVLVNVVQQLHGCTNSLMAILMPVQGGYLETKEKLRNAQVIVSKFNSQVTFVLSTFSEDNKVIPLDWKSGGYIRGVLVGRV